MARVQTRRTISFNRVLFEQCCGVAERLRIPAAQLAEIGLREVLLCDDGMIIQKARALPSRATPKGIAKRTRMVRRLLRLLPFDADHEAVALRAGVPVEFVIDIARRLGPMPSRGRPVGKPSRKVLKIRKMLADGIPQQEIADRLRCSRQYVNSLAKKTEDS